MPQKQSRELNTDSEVSIDLLKDAAYLSELREQMIKFAILQLQDESTAEDVVQEALVGALKNAKSFQRKSALKTWVFAILKNKIIDSLRKGQKTVAVSQICEDQEQEIEALFDNKGHWHQDEKPKHWEQPEGQLEDEHFWRAFDICLNALPAKYARFFMMREFLELETHEICENETLNANNLHVILYRARVRLRECLENGWFAEGKAI